MEGKPHTLSKKSIIAIIAIVILLAIVGVAIGIFLSDKGESSAFGDENEQIVDENRPNDEEKQNQDSNNNQNQDDNIGNNEEDNQENNNETNNTENNNTEVTTGTNVDEVGETTITRVEEKEKLVSENFWDWWTPVNVAVESTTANINTTIPELEVKKEVSTPNGKSVVYKGEEITYTIYVTNKGNKDVENIEITDKIPQNTTFVAFNENTKGSTIVTNIDGKEIVVGVKWIATVKAGETVKVTFTVRVNDSASGTIANIAIANGEESNETETSIITSNKSSVITRLNTETNKYEKVDIAKIGDRITYTITVTNTGNADGEVAITDTIPEGTKLISVQEQEIQENQDEIAWTVKVPSGKEITREFVVEVIDIDKEIKNIATVGGEDTNEDVVETADIEIIKNVKDIKRNGVSIGKDAEVKAGDVIEYTITVTNTGSADLTNVTVDEKLDGIVVNEEDLQIGDLASGESREIKATYTVTYEKDIKDKAEQKICNKVDVKGEEVTKNPEKEPETVYDEDDVETPVADAPSYTSSKTAKVVGTDGKEKEKVTAAGDKVKYTITVENTGNVTLKDIVVKDEMIGVNTKLTIGVGETKTVTGEYTVTQEDMDNKEEISNTAIVGDQDPSTEVEVDKQPSYTSSKTAKIVGADGKEKEKVTAAGDVIKYTITVTNTGNVTLKDIIVKDEMIGINTTVTVGVGETATVTGEYTVTQEDMDNKSEITNTAIVGDQDPSTEVEVDKQPSYTSNKTAKVVGVDGKEKEKVTVAGDKVKYTITVTNTGNVTLKDIVVKDEMIGINTTVTVEVGETATVTGEYTVTQEDMDNKSEITNTAIVGDQDPSTEVEVDKQPSYTSNKTAKVVGVDGKEKEKVTAAGDKVKYTITVTNTGNVTLKDIVVKDEMIEINTTVTVGVGETKTVTGEYTVTQEDMDNKKVISNTAIVGDQDPSTEVEVDKQPSYTSSKTAKVVGADGKEKEKVTAAGDVIKYTITVTNTGNVTLKDIVVKDEMIGINTTVTVGVGETATVTGEYTVTQEDIDNKEKISNTAIVGEQNPTTEVEIDKNPGINVDKEATKVNGDNITDTTKVRPGDVIEYTIKVTNTGNVTLKNIEVTDSLIPDFHETIASLAPTDEPVELKAYYTVTETDVANLDKIYNVAVATVSNGLSDEDEDETILVNKDTSVTINKIWNDNNNQDGKRPETITINLYADGKYVKSETISGTTYTFEKLPTYNENGNVIVYTVTENEVEDYTTSYSQDTFTITNTHTPETIDVPITKIWEDKENQDNLRPNTISVTLKANGTEKQTVEITAKNNWTYTFENLPKYENGIEIKYEVIENNVPDTYTSKVTGNANEGFKITNTHEVLKTEVKVTKSWVDANNQDGIRPESVSVTLYANGEPTDKTVTLSEENEWTYTFTELDVNANGKAISYTVKENNVPDTYTSEVTGNMTEGYTIVNTHEVLKTEIKVTKSWVDNNNQDGIRPESVSVTLYANGEPTDKIITLSEENKWTYTFTGLDVNANGKAISYTVKENNVPDTYTSEVTGSMRKGYTITNTHIPYTINIPVTKVWEDSDNQDGKRPNSIEITISANGTPVNTVELSEANGWTYTFTGLAVNKDGKEINYVVTESKVPDGYSVNITGNKTEGFKVTNIHVTDKTSITVEKSWIDANNQDGIRPESVDLILYANNKVIDTVTVNDEKEWKHTFTDLPVYENGKKIEYTVDESVVTDGYEKQVNGYVVTNTHIPEETEITVSKVWNDNDNQDGIRPKAVNVTLYANGNKTNQTVTLSMANDWTQTFTNLPVNDNGEKIEYTVQEENVAGYTSQITNNENGFIITNTHIVEKTSVKVNKVWVDGNNQDGIRTDSVNVTLYANGVATDNIVTLSEENNWSATFTNLNKRANGKEIAYTVVETNVPDGYSSTTTENAENGYTITNTHIPAITEITVNKKWEDNNNQDGIRPELVSVTLYANGKATDKTITLSQTNNWTYTFEKLPVNENGTLINYTVVENNVKTGYTSNVAGNATDGYTITNIHVPETTSVTVTKVWNDNKNQDGIRPDSVGIKLMNGIATIDTQTLSSKNNWTYTFEKLPKYENGREITYSVIESTVPDGYLAEVTGNITDGYTITNTHTPVTINIPVTKVWQDNNNAYNARKSIEVTLKANSVAVSNQTVTITENDNWTHIFENLPKYENGIEIEYTVAEKEVKGYQTTITGNATVGYTITNTYNNVTINKKTLTSEETSETTEDANVDVIFVLDTSSSMQGENAKTMNSALNDAMKTILKNPNNRVGVVGYSDDWYEDDSVYTVLLDLNHYTAKNDGKYILLSGKGDNTTLTTNVNELRYQNSRRVRGATYTQIGIKEGAELLTNSKNTTTKDRTPVIILLTDGEPTRYTKKYSNVGDYTNGNGTESAITAEGAYYNIMTARHYKQTVDSKYRTQSNPNPTKFFTIGINMDKDDIYQNALLNPNATNINKCKNSYRDKERGIYNYLKNNYIANGGTGRLDNNLGYYSYADGSYIGKMDEEQLKEILTEITESIIKHYETTTTTTSNIGKEEAKVELENLDVAEKITIVLDGVSRDYTLDQLNGVVTQEAGKYYMNLKAPMFNNIKSIEITYYEESSVN